MKTGVYEKGLTALIDLIKANPDKQVGITCSEGKEKDCHRQYILADVGAHLRVRPQSEDIRPQIDQIKGEHTGSPQLKLELRAEPDKKPLTLKQNPATKLVLSSDTMGDNDWVRAGLMSVSPPLEFMGPALYSNPLAGGRAFIH